ncbi:M20/M25/M40 family metallo-hydrolase [Halobaculum sp. MBLA0147]|uniref:M20/M25/M40 family metallo-hydrolase n=1 Tax=Halobaculum sp. MBLA0147 TaxID=3079934 RepID=UPI003525C89A
METPRREFLESLLETPSPSGYETPGQAVWTEYVAEFADEVSTDAYGNAVAVHEGDPDVDVEVAIAGHADEIGFAVRDVTEDGFLRLTRVGGSDRTVSKGQHVTVHADEPVAGVIGQTAIHLRDGDEEYEDVAEQFVDVGVDDGDAARELVEIGDPVTFSSTTAELAGSRLSARGVDNRAGTWVAAETLRRAVEADVDATVYAVSTVQEELGLQGAKMVGFDLDPDAFVAVDVTHATDNPDVPEDARGPVELGAGPVVARGSANHPALVELVRGAGDEAGIDYQLQATGSRTGTDADAFFTARGGTPALNVGLPNRYMHTPVEVIDTADLTAAAELLAAAVADADAAAPFTASV